MQPELLDLARKPESWTALCEHLYPMGEAEFSSVLDELDGALAERPDNSRTAPYEWMRDLLVDDNPPPALALTRTLEITDDRGPITPADWANRVARAHHLKNLGVLSFAMLTAFHEICYSRDGLLDSRYHYLINEHRMSFPAAKAFLLEDFQSFFAEDLATILAAPHAFSQLHTLNVDGNLLGDELVSVITAAADGEGLPALRHLHIAGNSLSIAAITRLLDAPLMARLETVDARKNKLKAAAKKRLKQHPALATAGVRL